MGVPNTRQLQKCALSTDSFLYLDKKLSRCRETARRAMSVEILSTAAHCVLPAVINANKRVVSNSCGKPRSL